MKNMHVLLLCGGGGAEHEVSLRSANFLEQQLGLLPGVEVTRVEMFADRWLSADGRECKLGLDKLLSFDSVARPVDYVVPCIHGYPGETGDLQSFLELAGLPYLGCDAEASKICFNKISTKLWLSAIGIPNTPYLFLTEQGDVRSPRREPRWPSGARCLSRRPRKGHPWAATPPATRRSWCRGSRMPSVTPSRC